MKEKGGEFIWFDGKLVKWHDATVPVVTHALHYGTAVFEGIRAYATKKNTFVFRLLDHMVRLQRSAKIYSFALPYSTSELSKAAVDLLKANDVRQSSYIRPLTFVGSHGIDLNITKNSPTHTVIITFPFAKYFGREGIRACVSSWRRIHDTSMPPLAKAAGNYLNSILATQECRRTGFDEAILLDNAGNVSEASGENIFLVRNGELYTPYFADSALEGITRHTAMTIATELGYSVRERSIPRAELYIADEIFVTGTAAEIVPVVEIDGKSVGDGKEGAVTKSVREAYDKIVTGERKGHSDWLTPIW